MKREQVKERFIREGRTYASFARENNFNPRTVAAVINGLNKGRYGEAHRVAVALGLKPDVRGEL